jgi:hypothetical protein
VALIVVGDNDMLQVLGHVQLSSSSSDADVELQDLCVAPHLQVCPPTAPLE